MMNMPKKYKVVAVSGSLQTPSRTLVLVEHIVSALGEVLPIETEVISTQTNSKTSAITPGTKLVVPLSSGL